MTNLLKGTRNIKVALRGQLFSTRSAVNLVRGPRNSENMSRLKIVHTIIKIKLKTNWILPSVLNKNQPSMTIQPMYSVISVKAQMTDTAFHSDGPVKPQSCVF